MLSNNDDEEAFEQPVNRLCWNCGAACECWPLRTKDEMIAEHADNPVTRSEFALVRAGVKVAKDVLQKQKEKSSSTKMILTRVIRRFAFVSTDTFAWYFKTTLENFVQKAASALSISTIFTPDAERTTGIMMQMAALPPDLPHDIVELESNAGRVYEKTLEDVDTCFRPKQAQERHDHVSKEFVKSRVGPLKPGARQKAPTYAEMAKMLKVVSATRDAEAAASAAVHSSAGSRVNIVSSTKFQDDGDDMCAATPSAGQGAKPGAKAKVAPTGTRRARLPSGSPPAPRRGSVGPAPRTPAFAPGTPSRLASPGTPAFSAAPGTPGSFMLSMDGRLDNTVDDSYVHDLYAVIAGENKGRELKRV